MISIDEIKELLTDAVKLEKELRATSDFRGQSSKLFHKLNHIKNLSEQNFGKNDKAKSYADKVKALIEQRLAAMGKNNEYNPVAVQIFEKTELDLLILENHLKNSDFKVRLDAVAAVEELDYKGALSKLLVFLEKEEHPWVISKFVKVVGLIGHIEELEILVKYLDNDDERIRANCIEGISAIKGTEKYQYIMEALDDRSSRVRANALNALKHLGGKEFAALLKQMVNSTDEDVRHSVLFVLKNMNNQLGKHCLLKLMNDRAPDIQIKSAEFLGQFKEIEVVKVLTEAAKSSDSKKLKHQCIKSLDRIRKQAKGPLLIEINKILKEAVKHAEQHSVKEANETTSSMNENTSISGKSHTNTAASKDIKAETTSASAKSGTKESSVTESTNQSDNSIKQDNTQTTTNSTDNSHLSEDELLLAELANFSEPGDISPSRVASKGKEYENAQEKKQGNGGLSKQEEINKKKAEQEEDAIKKTLARMNTYLKQLAPRLKKKLKNKSKQGK